MLIAGGFYSNVVQHLEDSYPYKIYVNTTIHFKLTCNKPIYLFVCRQPFLICPHCIWQSPALSTIHGLGRSQKGQGSAAQAGCGSITQVKCSSIFLKAPLVVLKLLPPSFLFQRSDVKKQKTKTFFYTLGND